MMYWNGDWSGWAWFGMAISMLVFWSLVGLGIWWLIRASTPQSRSPEDVLRQRYAAGELDDEEYQRRLQTLRHHSTSS